MVTKKVNVIQASYLIIKKTKKRVIIASGFRIISNEKKNKTNNNT